MPQNKVFLTFEAITQQKMNSFPFIDGVRVTTQPRYSENTLGDAFTSVFWQSFYCMMERASSQAKHHQLLLERAKGMAATFIRI